MFAEIAQILLVFSFLTSLFYGVTGLYITNKQDSEYNFSSLRKSISSTSIVLSLLLLSCFLLLMQLFIVSDFSVLNVAQNSNALLPTIYKITATWGSHEGSFLLWVLMLSFWTSAVAYFSSPLSNRFQIRVLSVLLLLQSSFLIYLIFASNPFIRTIPAPISGQDLNPLLQDPFMIIHPPILYMGYVGFAVCFSFAIAALIEGKVDSIWAKWCRPWANFAWAFLTMGILLGSWWAYRELGWGGWWFWDPVENASLMPWFAGTALIHSLAVTDKRNALKSWTVLLAIIAFGFSLLGTFLVRSGVLTSVHSFASDPTRGVFILMILATVMGLAFLLYGVRTKNLGMGDGFSAISKESLLLVNNILMTTALAVVMLGTLYPLIAEVFTGRKMSVGPPYFNTVITPILLPAVFFMCFAPWILWRKSGLSQPIKPLVFPFLASIVVAVSFLIFESKTSVSTSLAILCSISLFLGTIYSVFARLKKIDTKTSSVTLKKINHLTRFFSLGFSYLGMVTAHIGLAIFTLAVAFVMSFEIEKDLVMKPGQNETIGSYTINFLGVRPITGINYSGIEGLFEVFKNGDEEKTLLSPQKRKYIRSNDPMTEAAILQTATGDFYISLGDPTNLKEVPVAESPWTIRASYKPMMAWVWFGCLLMAIGGILAVADKRYISKRKTEKKLSSIHNGKSVNKNLSNTAETTN